MMLARGRMCFDTALEPELVAVGAASCMDSDGLNTDMALLHER
jgi:hypothetical protein